MAVTGADEMALDGGIRQFGKLFAEKCLPFLAEDEHESCVARGCVDGSEGHDVEGVQLALGPDEAEFMAVGASDGDLVETGLCIDADPVEVAGAG